MKYSLMIIFVIAAATCQPVFHRFGGLQRHQGERHHMNHMMNMMVQPHLRMNAVTENEINEVDENAPADLLPDIFGMMDSIQKRVNKLIEDDSFVKINNMNEFVGKMKCTPTVEEGEWYKMKTIRCIRENGENPPLQEVITPTPEAEQEISMLNNMKVVEVKRNWTPIIVLSVIVCLVVAAVIAAVVIYAKKDAEEKALTNNRIIVSNSNIGKNYGTF